MSRTQAQEGSSSRIISKAKCVKDKLPRSDPCHCPNESGLGWAAVFKKEWAKSGGMLGVVSEGVCSE